MHTIQTRNSVPVFQSAGNPVPIGIPAESGRNMQPRCHSQLLIVTVRNGCVLFPPSHLLTLAHAFSHFLTLWQSYTSVSTVTIHKKSFMCKTVGPKSEKIENFQTKNLHFFRIFLAPLMLLIPHQGIVVRGFHKHSRLASSLSMSFFPSRPSQCNPNGTRIEQICRPRLPPKGSPAHPAKLLYKPWITTTTKNGRPTTRR